MAAKGQAEVLFSCLGGRRRGCILSLLIAGGFKHRLQRRLFLKLGTPSTATLSPFCRARPEKAKNFIHIEPRKLALATIMLLLPFFPKFGFIKRSKSTCISDGGSVTTPSCKSLLRPFILPIVVGTSAASRSTSSGLKTASGRRPGIGSISPAAVRRIVRTLVLSRCAASYSVSQ